MIDVRLLEKTEKDRNLSFPKQLTEFAEQQKLIPGNDFDTERDHMVIVFDADIFEEKVSGYEEFIACNEELFLKMSEDGIPFYRSINGVWLAKAVPVEYLEKMSTKESEL